jgi:glutamine synthetase
MPSSRHPQNLEQPMATPADAIRLIKEKEAKFVDLRFTDTRGKEQHVTIPARVADEDFFAEGKMFDGSSIAGWKGINESDMLLVPRPRSPIPSSKTPPSTSAATSTSPRRCRATPAARA